MTQEAKDRTRKIVLELDDLDYDCLQKEVARYQSQTRAPANGPDEPGGVILPDEARDKLAALESELAALRQVVADVETCSGIGVENGVTIFGDDTVMVLCPALHDDRFFHAPTWQAALHAAAEHVRREATANDPSTGRE